MYLAFYNPTYVGDVLMLIKKETNLPIVSQIKGRVTRIAIEETDETVAYNIFDASQILKLEKTGQILLDDEQVAIINDLLVDNQFEIIEVDNRPKFVVGFVKECVPHPDSDHLHITQVDVGEESVLQIVCGAANIAQGQYVVVAKVGAVMPNGLIIFPGALRGVDSNGMICSKKELHLPLDGSEKGILVLDEQPVGTPFTLGV